MLPLPPRKFLQILILGTLEEFEENLSYVVGHIGTHQIVERLRNGGLIACSKVGPLLGFLFRRFQTCASERP